MTKLQSKQDLIQAVLRAQKLTLVVEFKKQKKYLGWLRTIKSDAQLRKYLKQHCKRTVWMEFETEENRDFMEKVFRQFPHTMEGKTVIIK